MNERRNDFDRISPFYDSLASLVFGSVLTDAACTFLSEIPPGSKVVILGGGTGRVLRALLGVNPTCEVWYIEASENMLKRARKAVAEPDYSRVHFIHGTHQSIPEKVCFDVVITDFFLDLFPASILGGICRGVAEKLRPGGLWLATDFINGGKWWHPLLLWLMYRFFRLTCDIEASKLPEWGSEVEKAGMKEQYSKLYFRHFIRSTLYIKWLQSGDKKYTG